VVARSDGYVRPGQLALYRPSAVYSNYRLEFFAEIESKSWVGWSGADPQNYYAMKFTVVDPGLRHHRHGALSRGGGRRAPGGSAAVRHGAQQYAIHVSVDVKATA